MVKLRSISSRPEQQRIVAQRVQLVLAQIVAAALHVTDLQRAEEQFEKWHILEEELLLQILGAGGDDHALLALSREPQRGQQIRERFARSGAGLDDQVALLLESLLDGAGHLVLPFAMLESQAGA